MKVAHIVDAVDYPNETIPTSLCGRSGLKHYRRSKDLLWDASDIQKEGSALCNQCKKMLMNAGDSLPAWKVKR